MRPRRGRLRALRGRWSGSGPGHLNGIHSQKDFTLSNLFLFGTYSNSGFSSSIPKTSFALSTRLFPFWKQSLLATVRYAICIFCKLHICMKHLLHLNSSVVNYHSGLCKTCTSPSGHHHIRLCSQNIMFREHNLQPLEFEG